MSKVREYARCAQRALRRKLNYAAVTLAGWAAIAKLVALILFELLKPGRPQYRRAGSSRSSRLKNGLAGRSAMRPAARGG